MSSRDTYQAANEAYQTQWRKEVSIGDKLAKVQARHLALPEAAFTGEPHEDTVLFLRLRSAHEKAREDTKVALTERDRLYKTLATAL